MQIWTKNFYFEERIFFLLFYLALSNEKKIFACVISTCSEILNSYRQSKKCFILLLLTVVSAMEGCYIVVKGPLSRWLVEK